MYSSEKIDKFILLLIALSIIITLLLYPNLPEKIPSHWNLQGEIDGFSNKDFSLFTASLPLVIYLVIRYLFKRFSKKELTVMQNKAYTFITAGLVLFFLLFHWIIIFSAWGYSVYMSRVMSFLFGLLFFIIGLFLNQIEPNHIMGIRTPWTLKDERIWRKTHDVGKLAFILVGVIFIIAGIINTPFIFTFAIISIFFGQNCSSVTTLLK